MHTRVALRWAFALSVAGVVPLAVGQTGQWGWTTWEQPPIFGYANNVYDGWNQLSSDAFQTITADDWVCQDDSAIVEIHWWGSYLNWTYQSPPVHLPRFHLAIWTDVSPGPELPYSHPGTVVWEEDVTAYAEQFAGWDQDPRTGAMETCFRYSCVLDKPFQQDPGQHIYWLSIAAEYNCPCNGDLNGNGVLDTGDMSVLQGCLGKPPTGSCTQADLNCDGSIDQADVSILVCMLTNPSPAACCPTQPTEQYPWGWKTRPRVATSLAPDAAIAIGNPTGEHVGDVFVGGYPLAFPGPYPADQWDLAFELVAQPVVSVVKWDQPPRLNPQSADPGCFWGWDELSLEHGTQIVADDWVCSTSAPVTSIQWWGSYIGWNQPVPPTPPPVAWVLTIWSDSPTLIFSHPNQVLWQVIVPAGAAQEMYVGCDYHPDHGGEATFRYAVDLTRETWFYQTPSIGIYWLSIAPIYASTQPVYPWGWKTRLRDPLSPAPDAAVRIYAPTAPGIGDLYASGAPIITSEGPWNLAFKLMSVGDGSSYVKWSQPPVLLPLVPIVVGWDESSQYSGAQIVADDWTPGTYRPVSAVHWWGSFIGWAGGASTGGGNQLPPGSLPTGFCFSIWTDVPGGPVDPYSHPGKVIWEAFAPWSYVTRLNQMWWDVADCGQWPIDATYELTATFPPAKWFFPPRRQALYWLSIAATYCTANADMNGDGVVNDLDAAPFHACVGQDPLGPCAQADLNCDGVIDGADVELFAQCLVGGSCPQAPLAPQYPFGVKTRLRDPTSRAPDDAVRVFIPTAPVLGSLWASGVPIACPAGTTPNYDLAFVLMTPPSCGDLNCDGLVNNGDIDPFILAITNLPQYRLTYPGCDWMHGDCNFDGLLNNGDIDDFIMVVTGGG